MEPKFYLSDSTKQLFTAKRWREIYPPWRPSVSDINIFKKLINQFPKNIKCLVLGATPEIRDILCESGVKSRFLADINSDVFDEMTQVRKDPNDLNECLVIANWLLLPFESKMFDIIISDLPFWVLPDLESHRGLIKECHRILKDNGSFIVRVHFLNANFKEQSLDEFLDWICTKSHQDGIINSFEKFRSFFSAVIKDYCTSVSDYKFDKEFYRLILSEILKKSRIPNFLIACVQALLKDINTSICCIPEKKFFCNILENKFKIMKTFTHHDLSISPDYPILHLIKI